MTTEDATDTLLAAVRSMTILVFLDVLMVGELLLISHLRLTALTGAPLIIMLLLGLGVVPTIAALLANAYYASRLVMLQSLAPPSAGIDASDPEQSALLKHHEAPAEVAQRPQDAW